MKRRQFLVAGSGLVASHAFSAETPGVNRGEILLGQTADFSASRSVITKAYAEGAHLYFDRLNKQGGIYGRKLRLLQLDDAYQAGKAMDNARKLVEGEQVFALMHSVGTAIVEKLIPYVEAQAVPHLHPLTGADQVRAPQLPSRQTFFLRASYRREVEKMVLQVKTLGISSIALVHEDEPFGQGIRALVQEAVQAHGLKLAATGVLPFNKPAEVARAVAAVARAQPTAVIMGSAGPSVENFMAAYHRQGGRAQYYCLSVSNVERLFKALGRQSEGIVVSQVMPAAQASNLPVARDYRQAAAAEDASPGSFGLEGFVSARIIADALQAAGPGLTRERFITALERPAVTQVGGFPLSYRGDVRSGSPFVELAMIGSGGRLLQ
ncbi:MAG: ABC transporter substrate-binding protein [Burkholderiales bacterium]|nr:ABC transporter substrate-binding protein [Burkholderiales bacterium]